jgi:hypothetical protein
MDDGLVCAITTDRQVKGSSALRKRFLLLRAPLAMAFILPCCTVISVTILSDSPWSIVFNMIALSFLVIGISFMC